MLRHDRLDLLADVVRQTHPVQPHVPHLPVPIRPVEAEAQCDALLFRVDDRHFDERLVALRLRGAVLEAGRRQKLGRALIDEGAQKLSEKLFEIGLLLASQTVPERPHQPACQPRHGDVAFDSITAALRPRGRRAELRAAALHGGQQVLGNRVGRILGDSLLGRDRSRQQTRQAGKAPCDRQKTERAGRPELAEGEMGRRLGVGAEWAPGVRFDKLNELGGRGS